MVKFCFSIKDSWSQVTFNDSAIKGLRPKIWVQGPKFLDCYKKICFAFRFKNSNWFWRLIAVLSIQSAWDQHHRYDNQFFLNSFWKMSCSFQLNDSDKHLPRHSMIKELSRIRCPSHDVTDFINFEWFYSRPPILRILYSAIFQIFRP